MHHEPTHLDLFSGVAGFSIAAEWAGFRTVAFAETDEDASIVLAHYWPDVPNLGDVRTIGVQSAIGRVDLITGGVPCQPASLLGKRLGSADARWLWPDAIRIVGELRPRFAIFENPPAILSLDDGRAFGAIQGEMAALGYDVLWGIIPAASVGAGHLRERLCIICVNTDAGHAAISEESERQCEEVGRQQLDGELHRGDPSPNTDSGGRGARRSRRSACDHEKQTEQALQMGDTNSDDINRRTGAGWEDGKETHHSGSQPVADPDNARLQGHAGHGDADGRAHETRPATARDLRGRVTGRDWWHEANTGVPVLAHGLSTRMAESFARCTGNAIVPQAFFPILHHLHRRLAMHDENQQITGVTVFAPEDDTCGFCCKGGADKIPHPILWPGEESAGTPYVHAECEANECERAMLALTEKQRLAFLQTIGV